MQPLVPLSFPMQGVSLIEASAGTGKTYTIVNLYLRLVLGHQCEAKTVEQILVLTFTNAATAELRSRVSSRLLEAYEAFLQGDSDDGFLQSLIAAIPDTAEAISRLNLALHQLDEASIYTIHGFCQRVLHQYAFESNSQFGQDFILDDSHFIETGLKDFWRSQVQTMSQEQQLLVLQLYPSWETLMQEVRPWLSREVTFLGTGSLEACWQQLAELKHQAVELASWWLQHQLANVLLDADLKANTKLGKAAFIDIQAEAIEAIASAEQFSIVQLSQVEWGAFSNDKIIKASKKASKDLSCWDFGAFEQLAQSLEALQKQLKTALLVAAKEYLHTHLANAKHAQNLIAPDDLLQNVHKALTGAQGSGLIKVIRQAYPVLLVDEFQDTDPIQYQTFEKLYGRGCYDADGLCWIMIGDPKQAIYAFRGADIFTYLLAKNTVSAERHFNLDTNWRSQGPLVDAINRLFISRDSAFKFDQAIGFTPVKGVKSPVQLKVAAESRRALSFSHCMSGDDKPISWSKVQGQMAHYCASQIVQLLESGQLVGAEIHRPVQASDICVLVRDRVEAALIKEALDEAEVLSVFLIRQSVFASQSAMDLLALLRLLAYPTNEAYLKACLLSESFAFDSQELDALLTDDWAWQSLLQEFASWHKHCQGHRIMQVLNQVMTHFSIADKLAKHYTDGMRRLTDWRHLIELLQHQSLVSLDIFQLLLWFEQAILSPDHNHEAQQLRLEDDSDLVQIVTQHASKGLEYPIVFIPFASRCKTAKQAAFHQQDSLYLDLANDADNLDKADAERLAEDIRLFYVAVTRAKYHCAIGLWHNSHPQRKTQSQWHLTALGWLLTGHQDKVTDTLIANSLQPMAGNADIDYQAFTQAEKRRFNRTESTPITEFQGLTPIRQIRQSWRYSSYSSLLGYAKANSEQEPVELHPSRDDRAVEPDQALPLEDVINPYSFIRGPQAGSFLHEVLEQVLASPAVPMDKAIAECALKFGIDEKWHAMVANWLTDVMQTPWYSSEAESVISLNSLKDIQVEMGFLLPVEKLDCRAFSNVINQAFKERAKFYEFEQLSGMLKGFIDLSFCHQGRYYVADYKSNYLGDNPQDYQGTALHQAMDEHDYHLQAILYVLALHRLLKIRLPNYSYNNHIGGAYYLFLRAMDSQAPGQGVYHFCPEESLVLALDALFAGIKPAPQTPQQQEMLI